MSSNTPATRPQFTGSMRFLHWLMAAMVLTMLGIGIAMVTSLGDYHLLVSIHRPLGIAILILVVIRFVNRQFSTLPPFPASMSSAGALRRTRIRNIVVYAAVCAAARRLGNVVRRAISDRPIRVAASFSHPSAQRNAVRVPAEDAHVSRLSAIPRIRLPFCRRSVPHAGCARRIAQPHGALAGPRALTSSKQAIYSASRRNLGSTELLPAH